MYMIEVTPEKCTGCRLCAMACSTKQAQVCTAAKSRIQIVTFHEEGMDVPLVCHQCQDAPCEKICPVNALRRDPNTGAIVYDYNSCFGCMSCLLVCPFGAISIDADTGKPFKCNLCGGDPQCVKFCETKALQYVPVEATGREKRQALAYKLSELDREAAEVAGKPRKLA
jgi:Fe-S-cluster-containing hydrogenase component 2